MEGGVEGGRKGGREGGREGGKEGELSQTHTHSIPAPPVSSEKVSHPRPALCGPLPGTSKLGLDLLVHYLAKLVARAPLWC